MKNSNLEIRNLKSKKSEQNFLPFGLSFMLLQIFFEKLF